MSDMTELGGPFDATAVAPSDSFDPLPNGTYVVIISDTEMAPTKSGGKMLKLTLEVAEGEYKGRKLWDQLNLVNANPKAVEIAQRTLSAICHAVGVLTLTNSTELHHKPLVAKVRVKQDEGYEPGNEVKGYSAFDGGALPVARPVSASAKPAAAKGPLVAPWAKTKQDAAA